MTAPVNTTLYMRPDRNLALELVRVTEAGAMAAGRWVGRGDKEAGDGAAVDAMRQLVALVSMRGGGRHRRGREGRSADALQRRGGRQRGRPGLRLRRRSRRRHHVDGQGHAECDLGAGGGRARRDVRSLGGVLHGEDRGRTGRRRRDRHHRAGVGEPAQGGPRRRSRRCPI